MSALFFAAVSSGGLLNLLVWVAIAAVVFFGILAILKWAGVVIPQPVQIVLWVFVTVLLIVLIARVFGVLV